MAFIQNPLDVAPYIVGPDQKEVTNLDERVVLDLTDDSHLNIQIQAAPGWDQFQADSPTPWQSLLAYWRRDIRTPVVLDDDHVYVGWSEYWASVITLLSQGDTSTPAPGRSTPSPVAPGNKNSKGGDLGAAGSFGFALSAVSVALAAGTAPVGVDTKCIPLSSLAKNGITQQLGLLQDDILYNLSLLCKNVLEPVKAKYPGITIVSGFRQVNTGIGQHERGQAADITIPSALDTLIYEVADFIVKTLQFDQVILNYSLRRSPWIHVSFSSTGLRRTALTRDFDDTFHSGLFLITEKTGEDRAAALREQAEYFGKIDADLKILEKRQTALCPDIVIGDATAPGMGSAKEDGVIHGGGGPCGEPDEEGTPNKYQIVIDVFDEGVSLGVPWDLSNDDLEHDHGVGRFVEAVVSRMPDEFGHILKTGAQTMAFGHAIDAIGYLSPTPLYNGKYMQAIDIIGAAAARGQGHEASIQWSLECAPAGNALGGDIDPNDRWSKTP
jgi:hypothetical protein